MFSCFWDFYADNRMALQACGRGYTGVASEGELALAIINPTSMANIAGWQSFVGYAYKSSLPWLKDYIEGIDIKTLHPCGMVGVGRSFNDKIQLGCLIYDAKSYRYDEGGATHVDETGEVISTSETYDDIRKTTLLLPLSIETGKHLKLGLGLEISSCRRASKYWFYEGEASFYDFGPHVGVILRPSSTMHLGLSYRHGLEHTYEEVGHYTSDWWSDTTWPSGYTSDPGEIRQIMKHHEPSVFRMGVEIRPNSTPFAFMADLNHVFIPGELSGLKDRDDLHLGIECRRKDTDYRAGFFTVRDFRVRSQYLNPEDNSQYFLTCGLTKYIGYWGLTLSLMDSHLLSPGEWKNTVVNGGASYLF